jgi:transposase
MPKRLVIVDWNEGQLEALGEWRKDARVERRIIALRMIHDARTALDAAKIVGVSDRTVREWVKAFNAEGCSSLRYDRHKGAESMLTPLQEEAVKKAVADGPPKDSPFSVWRGRTLQDWIKDRFGADYSLSGIYFLLHRLGFSSLVPRPRHPESDEQAQEEFKKNASRRVDSAAARAARANAGGLVPG